MGMYCALSVHRVNTQFSCKSGIVGWRVHSRDLEPQLYIGHRRTGKSIGQWESMKPDKIGCPMLPFRSKHEITMDRVKILT